MDETKSLKEDPSAVGFLNAGFNNSRNPVSSPTVPRYSAEADTVLNFNPRYPKALAGNGSFLESETLSRSIILRLQRTTRQEESNLTDISFYTEEYFKPLARKYTRYWTLERLAGFRELALAELRDIPRALRGRHRQKFCPGYAIAKLMGPELYELARASSLMTLQQSDVTEPNLEHQLLRDSAGIIHRELAQRRRGMASFVVRIPANGRDYAGTKNHITALLALPEGPWKSFGWNKKMLDVNGFFNLLRAYPGIKPDQARPIPGAARLRGFYIDNLLAAYERYRKPNESVSFTHDDDDQPEPPSGSPPSPPPQPPDPEPEIDPSGEASQNVPQEKDAPAESKDIPAEGSKTAVQVVQPVQPLESCTTCTTWTAVFEGVAIPDSTPKTGFGGGDVKNVPQITCLDLETFYPWPSQGDFPQPKMVSPGILERKQKRGVAHPWAKDPRRCALRFLSLNVDGQITTHDFFDGGPLPEWMRDALANSMLLGHNLDFDVTVLRRYGIEVSGSIVDTMLASRLLGLGKERGSDDIEDFLEDDENGIPVEIGRSPLDPSDNALDAVVERYLGIQIDPKIAKLGNSDWSLPLSEPQRDYIRGDVEHLPALWEVLKRELDLAKLMPCFRERMEFFPHLNTIKMTGNPINVALRDRDREECFKEKIAKREEIAKMFADYRPPVPPSRRRKVKKLKGAPQGVVLEAPPVETEEFNPNVPTQVIAALGLHGIEVENAQKKTLERSSAPECRPLIEYADLKARLSMIDGICRSTFPDGRVRPSGWNQLAARTGRLHSTEPTLQNIPRDWREAFEAPFGWLWLKFDLSQIEMYVLALQSGCQRLIEIFEAGKDVYVEVAAEVFHREPVRGKGPSQVSEDLRDVAKILCLAISYGMGVRSFIKQIRDDLDLEYDRKEAQGFFDHFFEMFPEIAQTHREAEEHALTLECVYTVTGQRRFLPPLVDDTEPGSSYWPSLQRRKRILVNTPVTGSAANLLIRAVNRFMPLLPGGVEVVNLVHDEVDMLVSQATLGSTVEIVTECFETTFRELFGDRLKVKLKYKVGKSWGSAE